MSLIDIGVNLTNKSLLNDLQGVFDRATAANVNTFIVTGTTLEDSAQALDLCESQSFKLFSTVGVHPHHASDWNNQYRHLLIDLAMNEKVKAIGEAGLDFNRDFSPRDKQLDVFEQQLQIAVELNMPVFLHQRDAHERFLEILKSYRCQLKNVVVHCFTDTREALKDYLELDCYIGITGWICDERRGLELQQSVSIIPDNRLMIETDAPYLLPRNLLTKPKSRINEPGYLPFVVQKLAECRQQPIDFLKNNCFHNTIQFFNLKKSEFESQ